jgi:very-short-patch-repair endonuclease
MNNIHNFKFRLMLTLGLGLGGFIFPFLFLLATLVGWSLLNDIRKPPEEIDEWFTRRYTTTADDPRWQSDFLQFCESPAEEAFLVAMIDAHDLTPDSGILCGNGLTLDLQVEMKPYRADFLVNNWLVVEIDGAAYHSSGEAVERDRVRDEFMHERGYTVLRIPAKVVFSMPDEAVDRVQSSLRQGKRSVKNENALPQSQPKKSFSFLGALESVNNVIESAQRHASLSLAVEKANKGYVDAFQAEEFAIQSAVGQADSQIKREQLVSQSKEFRDLYLGTTQRYPQLFRHHASETLKIVIPPVPENAYHSDPEINEAIERSRLYLFDKRAKFFNDIRERLNGNARLKELVWQNLKNHGCEVCWKYIT